MNIHVSLSTLILVVVWLVVLAACVTLGKGGGGAYDFGTPLLILIVLLLGVIYTAFYLGMWIFAPA